MENKMVMENTFMLTDRYTQGSLKMVVKKEKVSGENQRIPSQISTKGSLRTIKRMGMENSNGQVGTFTRGIF